MAKTNDSSDVWCNPASPRPLPKQKKQQISRAAGVVQQWCIPTQEYHFYFLIRFRDYCVPWPAETALAVMGKTQKEC